MARRKLNGIEKKKCRLYRKREKFKEGGTGKCGLFIYSLFKDVYQLLNLFSIE
jgi:hypothetical protein